MRPEGASNHSARERDTSIQRHTWLAVLARTGFSTLNEDPLPRIIWSINKGFKDPQNNGGAASLGEEVYD